VKIKKIKSSQLFSIACLGEGYIKLLQQIIFSIVTRA